MIGPCQGYVCHICGQGKHITTTIHCVCVGCQIINMQNRGICSIQEKSLNQVRLNDFPTVCKQLAPVKASTSGVHDLILLKLRASLTHFCFHVFHNRRELFIILRVLQIKTTKGKQSFIRTLLTTKQSAAHIKFDREPIKHCGFSKCDQTGHFIGILVQIELVEVILKPSVSSVSETHFGKRHL